MAANKLLLCLTLLSLLSFSAIASSSIHRTESIAAPPDPSPTSDSFVQRFSSLLSKASKGFHVPRTLSQGLFHSRGRSFAEVANKTSNSTSNKGDQSVGPAPAAAPIASNNAKTNSDDKQPPAVKWLAGIALGIATGILSAILASFVYRVVHDYIKRPKPNKPVVFQRKVIDSKALAFLEKEGALEALELLGKGGCGEVFKTTLENGKVVAIKKVRTISANSSQRVDTILEQSYDLTKNSAQIHAELDTLGQIRHRNLVTLLAYVPKPNAHILIYDFMENGSLHDALMKVWEGSLELTWPTRHKIAVGVAMGLKYLHFDCSPKIIHRDLKPGNILLDHDMEAHIGDFGLAKLMPDNFTHFTSNNLAGTVGYIAPEYHQTLRYTAKGDVYSFGVVLVVLLTGKEPTNHLFSDVYTHMGSWVTDILASGEDSAMAFLDQHLLGHGFEAQMFLAFKIASFCLHESPASRPTSNDILKMLDQIRPS